MKVGIKVFFASVFLLTAAVSCKEKNDALSSDKNNKVNYFIKETMEDVYLWYKQMPNIDITKESDSKVYFKKLLYTDDKWSYITDDAEALSNTLSGIETTFGYQVVFYRASLRDDFYFAVVEYVNKNSPASRAGVLRGDIFTRIDGQKITAQNYMSMIYGATINLTKAAVENKNIVETSETITLTSQKMTIDPVLLSKVLERNGKKVGYLIYTSYVGNFNTSLERVFSEFKSAGVSDVVLDLRFNGGGDEDASTYLCSSLAPKSVVDAKRVLVYNKWNDKYDAYWRANGYTNRTERRFESVPNNLDLSRLFVLTGNGTASASELTIVGLKPYMDVIQIGDTTYGKYTSMVLIQGKNEVSNWALMPIVAKYTNANGYSDFKNGLAPNHLVEDNLFPAVQLGEENESLLAAALQLIDGTSGAPSPKKVLARRVDFDKLNLKRSELDELKRNDIIKGLRQ